MPDGTRRPVMHAASSFSKAEKNYPQVQREALALTFAVRKFHRYIYGRKFELQTDHQPLFAIFGAKGGIPVFTASRLQRYALILLAYNFEIRYVNTKSFAYADFISRLIERHERTDKDVVIATTTGNEGTASVRTPIASIRQEDASAECFAIETTKTLPITFEAMKAETNKDDATRQLLSYVENGWPQQAKQVQDPTVARFFPRRDSLIAIKGVFLGDRVVVPARYRQTVLKELHAGHPGMARTKLFACSKVAGH
ncbi:PREDICTED: uncharacterized protein K02A2.6-like [Vollenhovia emeryi]|uniref:uncharacterized protein K02A2.6-like n=1 Tax=Vollenhovia emeryi TaxID=411798 RepID=UPI0005F478A1|nr:PREDICTED: uncharacterized protein K02A2.6-like [Vollenhovia emeryi]